MFQFIKDWAIQLYLARVVRTHHVYRQLLFDYNDDKWDLLASGVDDTRTNNLVFTFIDQALSQERNQILVAVIHTHEDTGYVMGMTSDKKHIIRWFMTGTYDMAKAFSNVALWCRMQQNYFIAKNKEVLHGQTQSQ